MELKEDLLAQLAKDAEVLMAEDLLLVKGGSEPKVCGCCCTERNGGAAQVGYSG